MLHDTLLLYDQDTVRGRQLHQRYRARGWEVIWAGAIDEVRSYVLGRGIVPLVAIVAIEGGWRPESGPTLEWIALVPEGTAEEDDPRLQGAFAAQPWPAQLPHLDRLVTSAARLARTRRQHEWSFEAARERHAPAAFIGTSAAARSIRARLSDLAMVRSGAIAFLGERGTGHRFATTIVHCTGSPPGAPFVEYDLWGRTAEQCEIDLFGREAAPGEEGPGRIDGLVDRARGGTLLVHADARLADPLRTRFALLVGRRVYRRAGGNVDLLAQVRVVFAVTLASGAEIDLEDHLADIVPVSAQVELPPLRSRIDDVEPLAEVFVARSAALHHRPMRGVAPDAAAMAMQHDWPGNVAELRTVVDRAVLTSDDAQLAASTLMAGVGQVPEPTMLGRTMCLPIDGSTSLVDMDRAIIRAALEQTGFNTLAAARLLRTTRQTLRYRIAKYGLKGGHPEHGDDERDGPDAPHEPADMMA